MKKNLWLWTVLLWSFGVSTGLAATYWAQPGGTMSGCTPSATQPSSLAGFKSTVVAGMTCLNSGDKLYLIGNFSNEFWGYTQWAAGTSSNPTIIANAPGQTVTISYNTCRGGDQIQLNNFTQLGEDAPGSFQSTVHPLVFDWSNANTSGTGNCGWGLVMAGGGPSTIVNVEVKGVRGQDCPSPSNTAAGGIFVQGDGAQVLNSSTHDNGFNAGCPVGSQTDGYGYGIYNHGANSLIKGNLIYNNAAHGMQLYSAQGGEIGGRVTQNKIYSNGQRSGSIGRTQGLSIALPNAIIDNNLIYDHPGYGITIGSPCSGCLVYNNTIDGNGGSASGQGTTGIAVTTPATFQNNIITNSLGSVFDDQSTGALAKSTYDHNLCFGNGGGNGQCSHTGDKTVDPYYASRQNKNFNLCTAKGLPDSSCPGTSPAIDAGINLGSNYSIDIVGTKRGQGAGWDMGAYEASGAAPPSCPASTIGPIVQLNMNEGTGTPSDSSGNGNNVTSLGTGVTWTISGKYGNALHYTGLGASTIIDSLSLFACNGWTWMAWIKPSNVPTSFTTVLHKILGPDSPYRIYSASDTNYFGSGSGPFGGYDDSTQSVFAYYTASFPINTWTHYTVTYDRTLLTSDNVKIYINGTQVTSAAGTTVLARSTGNLLIGGSEWGEYFQGDIDEVRGWNRALSQTEINTNMNDNTSPTIPPSATNFRIGANTRFQLGPNTKFALGK